MAETDIPKKESGSALVPKLRFPEFRVAEGWDQVSLKSIADPVRERAVQSENNEVLSLSAEYGLVLQGDFFGKKVAGDNVERYLKIVRNDFVYNDRATKATAFGTIKRLSKYASGIVSPIYKCFRFGNQEDSAFWECYFESGVHDIALRGLVNEGARAGRFNISIFQFLSTIASRPEIAEQQRISACLSSLDELIAAQAQKVEALKSHKKGLMQQLFPREGETRPCIRFPEFQNAGEWEATTLGEYFCPIRNGFVGTATPYYTSSDGVPYLQGKNVKGGRIDASNLIFITPEFHFRQKKSHLKTGDILMVQSGHVGECAVVGTDYEGCNCHALVILSPSRKLDSEFFVHYFYAPAGELAIFQITTGNTIKHILASELKTLPVLVPKPAEQQRIASCISNLDVLLTAETQKMESLKTHKKGLMQQLFPSTGGDEL